jgi:tryptophanyl-tRNA synthetase
MTKKAIVSGIQPTGQLHIGNYIGAISQWVEHQDSYRNILFAADLHALTIPGSVRPDELRAKSREVLGLYLACGIDADRSLIFLQSDVHAHAYLGWIFGCCTPIGWLRRMTQFKAKGEGRDEASAGLLTYPVLQAADVLAYRPAFVPVGDDQKQHVELVRDIAERFNRLFGEAFPIPEPLVRPRGARIMGLDDPTVKMSKSLAVSNPKHAIALLGDAQQIKRAISRAVTDSLPELRFDEAPSPGINNLLTIYQLLSHCSDDELRHTFEGKGHGFLKQKVYDVVMSTLVPIQDRYRQLQAGDLDDLLAKGASEANAIAEETLDHVCALVGVMSRAASPKR